MKAIALREFGGADVLRMEELPIPSPAPGEVLIRVHSVSVNRTLDLKVREGSYRTDLQFPVVLGADPAGVIVDTGAGVPAARCGERVSVVASIRCGDCRFCHKRNGLLVSCIPLVSTIFQTRGLDPWHSSSPCSASPTTRSCPSCSSRRSNRRGRPRSRSGSR